MLRRIRGTQTKGRERSRPFLRCLRLGTGRVDEGSREARAGTRFPAMPFPLYHHAKATGIKRSPRLGSDFMRRNMIAALALLMWGAGLTAGVAQQPVKVGVL